jgi:hypothetical protein
VFLSTLGCDDLKCRNSCSSKEIPVGLVCRLLLHKVSFSVVYGSSCSVDTSLYLKGMYKLLCIRY